MIKRLFLTSYIISHLMSPGSSQASDYQDTPESARVNTLDLNDLFAWVDQEQNKLMVVLTCCSKQSSARSTLPLLSRNARYTVHFDTDDDLNADHHIDVFFGGDNEVGYLFGERKFLGAFAETIIEDDLKLLTATTKNPVAADHMGIKSWMNANTPCLPTATTHLRCGAGALSGDAINFFEDHAVSFFAFELKASSFLLDRFGRINIWATLAHVKSDKEEP
jgi:hypothetical protein